jgi:hypothetical protein
VSEGSATALPARPATERHKMVGKARGVPLLWGGVVTHKMCRTQYRRQRRARLTEREGLNMTGVLYAIRNQAVRNRTAPGPDERPTLSWTLSADGRLVCAWSPEPPAQSSEPAALSAGGGL